MAWSEPVFGSERGFTFGKVRIPRHFSTADVRILANVISRDNEL